MTRYVVTEDPPIEENAVTVECSSATEAAETVACASEGMSGCTVGVLDGPYLLPRGRAVWYFQAHKSWKQSKQFRVYANMEDPS